MTGADVGPTWLQGRAPGPRVAVPTSPEGRPADAAVSDVQPQDASEDSPGLAPACDGFYGPGHGPLPTALLSASAVRRSWGGAAGGLGLPSPWAVVQGHGTRWG